jgi:hypothetical protein
VDFGRLRTVRRWTKSLHAIRRSESKSFFCLSGGTRLSDGTKPHVLATGRTCENYLGARARIFVATRCAAKIRNHQHGRFAAADNTNA